MNPLSETQARCALAGLRSAAVDDADVTRALARLLSDLPPVRTTRRPLLVPALSLGALGVAVLLVLGLVFGLHSPTPPSTPTSIADGLTGATSLVDVDGSLWASGIQPDGSRELARVDITTRQATKVVLSSAGTGADGDLVSLATAEGRIYAVTADLGIFTALADGAGARSLSSDALGTEAESLTASPGTGLWMLSCCGAAPAGQQLVTRRDPGTLAAVGDRREITAIPGNLLAAGPAGVWALDADTGAVRPISGVDTPAADPVVETDAGRIPHDLLGVGDTGPVLARQSELLTVNGYTLAVRHTPFPAGQPAPTALTVVGETAYLAFPRRVVRYDLSSLTETGSYPLTGVTALTSGPDGVWAATGSRLMRVAQP